MLLLVCGIFMLGYSLPLTLLTVAFVPAYALLATASNATVRSKERRIRLAFAVLANRFVEVLTNIRTVKAYALESTACDQLTDAHETMQRAVVDRANVGTLLSAGSTLLGGTATVALLWVGAHFVIDSRLSLGQLMFFYSVSTVLLASVDRLGSAVTAIQESGMSLERLHDVRALPQEHDGILFGWNDTGSALSVEFRNVTFGYGRDRPALRDASFRVSGGTTLALVGETGSGKSTLVALINGLYDPQHGQVLVNERDVRDMNRVALRKRIAVVQEPGLMTGTIRDNIAFGAPDVSFDTIRHAASLACAGGFINDLPGAYDYEVGAGGVGLSCGQRQRVAIARALLRNPAILVLDEATSNLDPETEQKIFDGIERDSENRITIIATHRIALAARARTIFVLDRGRIVERGSHEDLLNLPRKYHAMWNTLQLGRAQLTTT